MAKWGEQLLCEHEDLRADSSTHIKARHNFKCLQTQHLGSQTGSSGELISKRALPKWGASNIVRDPVSTE